jgi:hypothetical protein
VTHIAGAYWGVNGRAVQRCAWCGAKLLDFRFDANREPPAAECFDLGALVKVSGGRVVNLGRPLPGEPVAKDLCQP